MPVWGIVLCAVAGGVLLLFVIWLICVYNGLIKARANFEESFSTMDIYMKKRYDLIPNLVETVKGYAKHEKEALEGVMQARYSCMSANDPKDRAKKEHMLAGTLKTLFKVTENYPQLKANANFMDLQSRLNELEVDIVNARKYYNGCVKQLNNKIMMFPSNLVAKMFKFEIQPLFEIVTEEERENPKVKF